MMNPAECATGVVPSAPRVTVHVVPEMLVTRMISEFREMSAMWHWVGGVAEDETAGKFPAGGDRPGFLGA